MSSRDAQAASRRASGSWVGRADLGQPEQQRLDARRFAERDGQVDGLARLGHRDRGRRRPSFEVVEQQALVAGLAGDALVEREDLDHLALGQPGALDQRGGAIEIGALLERERTAWRSRRRGWRRAAARGPRRGTAPPRPHPASSPRRRAPRAAPRSDRTRRRRRASRRAVRARSGRRATGARPPRRGGAAPARARRRRSRARRSRRPAAAGSAATPVSVLRRRRSTSASSRSASASALPASRPSASSGSWSCQPLGRAFDGQQLGVEGLGEASLRRAGSRPARRRRRPAPASRPSRASRFSNRRPSTSWSPRASSACCRQRASSGSSKAAASADSSSSSASPPSPRLRASPNSRSRIPVAGRRALPPSARRTSSAR